MGELAIRRNRSFAVPQYQAVSKAEKQTGSMQSRKVSAGFTVSETLQQLMSRVSQAESRSRESRRTLQTGESVLAEVREDLDRIAKLVQKAAGDGEMDREALQAELEQLREDIDRMTQSASVGDAKLFLEEGVEDGTEALLYAVMGEVSAKQEVILPDWLKNGLAQGTLDAEQLLAGLGLDKNATPAELLAAIRNSSLEGSAGRLAALYLGAVIAGGGTVDPTRALEGLQQLLEKVSEGVPLDQAIEMLTGGEFTSLLDVQEQFISGTAPGMEEFLVNLLLSDSGSLLLTGSPALTLLAGMEGINLELLMGLMTAAQATEPAMQAFSAEEMEPAVSTLQLGTVQVVGQDLSGVSFHRDTGELIIGGTEDVTILGTDQGEQVIRITGSGTVTFQSGTVSTLILDAPEARVYCGGETVLHELQLQPGVSLTLNGGGLLKVGVLRADDSNTLRLTGGAVTVLEQEEITVPVLLEGAVSLAARASHVNNFRGEPLKPFDLVWKTLLPGWSSITAIAVDGRQGKMHLMGGDYPDAVRLWLPKGDHGYPHALALRGRDAVGHLKTRYAYLHWNQRTGTFEERSVYPNPFTITGGEPDQDWVYEEETQTLRILSNQVTAISGGSGTDTNQTSFSGRIVLADRIGTMELALGGVVCRVSSGGAFHLGRENDVTLILEGGTTNLFESGAGCAGISLGEGTCLSVDCAHGDSEHPAGTLTAIGNVGGAGIGRDSGGGRDRISQILIRGGVITATGTGGGAGIGAGKRGSMGAITILGGTITSTGGTGGGAGIGGALGAPVGDISIHGGMVTAVATFHAAAIGAGVQGACGDILITGTARIVKAQGGNPGADIGACLFGNCGNVLISGGADIGEAGLRRRGGIPLQMGEDTVMLPQFRLSSRALQLDRLSVLSREYAQAAKITVDADRRWINQIQAAYDTLHSQLEQSFHALHSVHQYIDITEGSVRDTAAASTLLDDMRQFIHLQPSQAMQTHSKRGMEDVRQLLR